MPDLLAKMRETITNLDNLIDTLEEYREILFLEIDEREEEE